MTLLRRLQLLAVLSVLFASSAALPLAPAAKAADRSTTASWSSGKRHGSNGFLSADERTSLSPSRRRRGITRLFKPQANSGGGAAHRGAVPSSRLPSASSTASPFGARQVAAGAGEEEDELAHLSPDSLKPTVGSNTYEIGSKSSSFVSLADHGGKILAGAVPLYLIYYGNWAGNKGQGIMEAFIKSINNTAADSQVRGDEGGRSCDAGCKTIGWGRGSPRRGRVCPGWRSEFIKAVNTVVSLRVFVESLGC